MRLTLAKRPRYANGHRFNSFPENSQNQRFSLESPGAVTQPNLGSQINSLREQAKRE
ncbi:MAG: hypothetical protein F6K53_41620 [Moorea sp. SIO4A1]|uniref:hypothetical protein n=1 Tax=Moorena sp. SIO4A1 TaxID=2607835 RepID=UPI0013BB5860|nr:hypothetical protein [Moorena sp. SIO4A1]NEO44558.1 hypothetical protein [Moorena sp. SIO4A3]NEQ63470.1 hypothetical protein [Moorena sp. SIO4A1]NEQ87453.1 hypothetical protein [Moorena sp. SIO2I5]